MTTKDINYLLTGLINGTYTEVYGEGAIDQSIGRMDLELKVKHAPKGWDPGIILLICCQNLRFYSAKLKTSPELTKLRDSLSLLRFGNEVNSQRTGYIKDPNGKYVVGMKAKGFLFVNENKLESKTIVTEGFSELDKFMGIKNVFPYKEIIRPTITGCADGLSVYKVECNDGSILEGHTHYPYVFGEDRSLSEDVTLSVKEVFSNSLQYFQEGTDPKIHFQVEQL
ncbi:hypothetical protein [Bacillus subtilis]|uniref:hypothetical protein n=1 Tax=Bacillus subtilis TaxID=1423 RepID=UPI00240DC7F9|nr:hypothetical protein [Bacillus subtilis]WFA93334.1 hypothetical protein LFL98_06445 [Bacillus subtilis]